MPIRGKEKVSTSEAWVQEGSSSQLYTDMKTGWSHAHNSLQGSLRSIVYACAQEEGGKQFGGQLPSPLQACSSIQETWPVMAGGHFQ